VKEEMDRFEIRLGTEDKQARVEAVGQAFSVTCVWRNPRRHAKGESSRVRPPPEEGLPNAASITQKKMDTDLS
jgi:hypothetical protein